MSGLIWLWQRRARVIRRKPRLQAKRTDIMRVCMMFVGAQQIMAKPTEDK